MKIHVGTTNPVKLRAARKAVAAFHARASIKGVAVESGVSAQPISLGEIVRGATTRAERCRGDGDLGIGIESGIFRVGGRTFGVTIAAVTDGTATALGGSPFLEMPRDAVEMVLKGEEELGEALAKVYDIPNPAKGGGAVGVLTRGRVTREKATEMAVVMAMAGVRKA
jgi:inosine/xanthosine triphosphatase